MSISSDFFFSDALQKMHVLCNKMRNGRSRLPKVVDFGTNRIRVPVCIFLLSNNSNVGCIFQRFRDIAGVLLKTDIHPTLIPAEIWKCLLPDDLVAHIGPREARQTDGRTHGQLNSNTGALHCLHRAGKLLLYTVCVREKRAYGFLDTPLTNLSVFFIFSGTRRPENPLY